MFGSNITVIQNLVECVHHEEKEEVVSMVWWQTWDIYFIVIVILYLIYRTVHNQKGRSPFWNKKIKHAKQSIEGLITVIIISFLTIVPSAKLQ